MHGPGEFVPKEHGAYGQVAFPLVTAFAVAGFSPAGLLLAAAVIAGFLAHEPAAILLGLRGSRAHRELGATARWWLACCLGVVIVTGLGAVVVLDSIDRWSLAIPAIPLIQLVLAMVNGQEKSWYGEAAAALAFAGVSAPITMAAGASIDVALAVAIPFAVLFATTTLAVRVVILRVRGGGNPRAAATTRHAALVIAGASAALMSVLAIVGWLRWSVPIASAPGLLAAAIVSARPPAAARLRTLGWTLVAVSTLTAVIVMTTA
jgi:hypothetical protein